MKTVLFSSIAVLLGSTAMGSIPHCNPTIYDAIYLRIVREQLGFNIKKLVQINKEGMLVEEPLSSNQIELFDLFRKLCYDQKSSYEVSLRSTHDKN